MKSSLVFTTHALRRMLKHGIRSEQVREALERGEAIENYPDETPLPSYLMLSGPARAGYCTWWQPTIPKPTRRS